MNILSKLSKMSSQKVPTESFFFVIPAKAGIQNFNELLEPWTPAFAGVMAFCETIKTHINMLYHIKNIDFSIQGQLNGPFSRRN